MPDRVTVNGPTYRLIPSQYPPIQVFEDCLNPAELDIAYALESLTNDRLRDQAGNISLVAAEDRISGPGTSVIMAAFTHAGTASRFTNGSFGVYYAGFDEGTALAESMHAQGMQLADSNEPASLRTMRCYRADISDSHNRVIDARPIANIHDPNDYTASRALGQQAKSSGQLGILYNSVRSANGQCIAGLKPILFKPAIQCAHYHFHWNGNRITHCSQIHE